MAEELKTSELNPTSTPSTSIPSTPIPPKSATPVQSETVETMPATDQIKPVDEVDLEKELESYGDYKKNNRGALTAVLAVIVILVIGAGVFAFNKYYLQSPERILLKSAEKMMKLKSAQFNVVLDTDVLKNNDLISQQADGSYMGLINNLMLISHFKVNMSGRFARNENNFDGEIKVQSEITMSNQKSPQVIPLDLEGKAVNNHLYFKLTQLPDFSLNDSSSIKGQWIAIDKSNGSESGQESNSKALTDDQVKKIKKAFKDYPIVKVIDKFDNEEIDGVMAYHYKLGPDLENLKNFTLALNDIFKENGLTNQEKKKFIDQYEQAIEKEAGKVKESVIEIWIGKDDYYIRQIKMMGEQKDVNSQFSATFSQFNQPMDFIEPSDAVDIKDVLGGLLGLFMTGVQPPASSGQEITPEGFGLAYTDTDNDGLIDSVEKILKTSNYLADTDNDGYSDWQEIRNGYNPLGPGRLSESSLADLTDEQIITVLTDSFGYSPIYLRQMSSMDLRHVFFNKKDVSGPTNPIKVNIQAKPVTNFLDNPKPDSPSGIYLKYKKDFANCATFDSCIQIMVTNLIATNAGELETYAESVANEPEATKFGFIDFAKGAVPGYSELNIIRETVAGDNATLDVTTKNGRRIGTVTMKRENGTWKIDQENWKL